MKSVPVVFILFNCENDHKSSKNSESFYFVSIDNFILRKLLLKHDISLHVVDVIV